MDTYAFGRFTVCIVGPYRVSNDFVFCFVSKIEEKFVKSLYLPDDDSSTVKATINLGENLRFETSFSAQLICEQNNSCCMQTRIGEEHVKGVLYCYSDKKSYKLPLTITIPKLYWRIYGLPNGHIHLGVINV